MINVIIIGGGNVAINLIKVLLKTRGVKLLQVYNRTLEKLKPFEKQTTITDRFYEIQDADFIILTVSDDSIIQVSKQLKKKSGIVLHTSGNVALTALKNNKNFGVFYPIQTFTNEHEVNFKMIPICIEANSLENEKVIEKFTKKLTKNVYFLNSRQRKIVHLAAVFVNNFVNHLYSIGYELLAKNQVPTEILLPLIKETASKLSLHEPNEIQTGPARRNDIKVLKNHLSLIENNQVRKVYKILTESILSKYNK